MQYQEFIDVIFLLIFAISVAVFGSTRSKYVDKLFLRNHELNEGLTLNTQTALLIPILGSISLLCFFYFFDVLSFLSTIFSIFVSGCGIFFCLIPLSECLPSINKPLLRLPFIGTVKIFDIMSIVVSCSIVISWITSGNWFLNNLMGASLCIVFISFIRIPNLKILTAILVCLFLYDIFWVFFSKYFFGENVMLSVATKKTNNPINVVAQKIGLPSSTSIISTLDLPNKFISGDVFLGLGDVVLGGLFLTFTLKYDNLKGLNLFKGYYLFSIIGYSFGLILSIIFAFSFLSAQPALFYIVPSSLGSFCILAWKRGQLKELWDEIDFNSPRNTEE